MKKMKFKPKNNVFQNWNKDLYIATKTGVKIDDYNNEIVEYSKPFYFGKANYQPMNSRDLQAYISAFGETKRELISLLIDYDDKDKIKEFDLAYLYGRTPKGEKINGEKANYVVKACRVQNTKVSIVLENIIEDNNVKEES